MANPGLVAVLSFIFNGLGQLYNGQIVKGLIIIALSSLSMVILIVGAILVYLWMIGKFIFPKELIWGFALFFIGLISICVIGIYSIMDAYKNASKK